jgi:hypothetical protein
MNTVRLPYAVIVLSFLIGFGLGGGSIHYATAQGALGMTGSIKQIGSTVTEMQKNVSELQKNMATLTQAKDQLSSLATEGAAGALKKSIPVSPTSARMTGPKIPSSLTSALRF